MSRFISMSLLRMASLFMAIGAFGCASSQRSVYEQCRDQPDSWGNNKVERVLVGPHGFHEDQSTPVDKAFIGKITRAQCLDTVEIDGFGISFRGGPFRPLWESALVASDVSKRLAMVHPMPGGETWVWLDGKRFGPYEAIDLGPRFSNNGRHVAWAVKEDGEQVLFVDGLERRRGVRLSDYPFYWVLDDGKVAASILRSDDKREVVVGGYNSGPLDELCSAWGFTVGPKGRFAYAARKGSRWFTVVDGREVRASGVPMDCRVAFTTDGTRYGYIAMPGRGGAEYPILVLDGRTIPLEDDRANDFRFEGELPVVRSSQKMPGKSDSETRVDVIDTPTPIVPPTVNDYEPDRGYANRTWERVRIGASLGPKFDRIKELSRETSGHIRYIGLRHEVAFEVIDNVIVVPPEKRGPVIAE